jgi:hypothetical protein
MTKEECRAQWAALFGPDSMDWGRLMSAEQFHEHTEKAAYVIYLLELQLSNGKYDNALENWLHGEEQIRQMIEVLRG